MKNKKVNKHFSKSLLSLMAEQFLGHKLATISLIIVAFFIIMALGAYQISHVTGLNPHEQNVFERYRKPFTTLEISKEKKEKKIRDFLFRNPNKVKVLLSELRKTNLIKPSGTEKDIFTFMTNLEEESFFKKALQYKALQPLLSLKHNFTTFHLLGTDELGRDVFIRLIYGSRVSIGVALCVTLFSAFIGLLIGVFAGLSKGLLDNLLMRFTDAFLSIPQIPLLIFVSAIDLSKISFLSGFTQNESIFKMILILCLFSWMTVARIVRSEVLTLKQRDFILVSQTLGASQTHILIHHLLPNVLAPLVVAITLSVGQVILLEAALSFLGLGIQPPTPSWGRMLFNAQEIIYEAPFLAIFPGLMIFILVIAFNFIGDGLQTAVNPKALKR